MNKGEKAGHDLADAIIQFVHLFYQKDTATRVLKALVDRLTERKTEFSREEKGKPYNPDDPAYKLDSGHTGIQEL